MGLLSAKNLHFKWKEGYKCRKCRRSESQIRSNLSRTCNKYIYTEFLMANTLFHKLKFGIRKAFFLHGLQATEKMKKVPNILQKQLKLLHLYYQQEKNTMDFQLIAGILIVIAIIVVLLNRKEEAIYQLVTYSLFGSMIYISISFIIDFIMHQKIETDAYNLVYFWGMVSFIFLGLFLRHRLKKSRSASTKKNMQ